MYASEGPSGLGFSENEEYDKDLWVTLAFSNAIARVREDTMTEEERFTMDENFLSLNTPADIVSDKYGNVYFITNPALVSNDASLRGVCVCAVDVVLLYVVLLYVEC